VAISPQKIVQKRCNVNGLGPPLGDHDHFFNQFSAEPFWLRSTV
jgi:hypothetical protein